MVAKMRNTLRERWMQLSELERKNELEKLRHMLTARWADPEQRHILSEKATLRWRRWRAEHGYTETWNKRRLVRPEERKQQTQEFRDSQAEKTRQVWAAMSKEERAAFVAKLAQARARARRRVA
jgi:hypothetical protein